MVNQNGNCKNCGILGLWAYECNKPKNIDNNKVNIEQELVLKEDPEINNNRMLIVDEINHVTRDSKIKHKWILDSGASIHACNSEKLFIEFIKINSSIIVGDDRKVKLIGRGTVKLKLKIANNIKTLVLKDVVLVPDLGMN